jgi:hypothetical protein
MMHYIVLIVLFVLSFAVQAGQPLKVSSFTSVTTDGSYKEGASINITATINDVVVSGSDLRVLLDTGIYIDLTNSGASTELVGLYTVGANENSADLNISSFSFGVDGVIAVDDGDVMSNIGLPNNNNLADSSDLVVDNTAPTVVSFTSSTVDGSYKSGDTINITATTEAIQSGNTLTVTLDTNDTVLLTAASAGTTLTGTYTVGSGDNSSDLTVSSFTIGTVIDTAGNIMTSTTVPSTNIASGSAIVVDTAAPTVTINPANGATSISSSSNITLTFNEAIRYIDNSTIRDNNVDDIITLKDTNASGADIAFDATISGNVITVNPDASFSSLQTVYVAIGTTVEDSADNAISAASATFTAADSASSMPKFMGTYPKVLQRNIGVDANIVLDFDKIVFASSNSAGGKNDRNITIYNAATGLAVFSELSNNTYVSGSGTTQITISPPNDFEERINYYVFIGGDAFYDGAGDYYPGISDSNSLRFMTAKDPNKYANVTASNETHVNHSMSQVEKSISAIVNRQSFVRRNGGKNTSNQGIKFTFNDPTLDNTLNKLAPLVSHFESYDVSRQLANAADKALPNGWGLWTSGEIALGNVNTDSGIDSTSKSKEISVGLDKVIDDDGLAGGAYRINKTETIIGNDGTQMDSSTKTWSVYGSFQNNERSTLEGLIGLGDISTDHTRVDGVNTYTGVRESQQVFACFIARENLHFKEANLSPFIRIDSSYTKQAAYSETGDSDTAYDALHYKSNNFHNTIFSVGVDTDISYQFGDKTLKPYLSLRHKMNTGYESSNEMYYLSNPIKEYTDVIASNSGESGFNLVIGADIQSESGWLITSSYELSESELIHNKSLRFRAEWKF